jgi:hypothetical protein
MLLAFGRNGARDTDLVSKEYTWEQFAQRLSKPSIGAKDGSYVVRGGKLREPKRSDENLMEAELLIIDGDSRFDLETGEILRGAPPIELAKAALDALNYRYIVHTSYSYVPGEVWKYRIFIPAKIADTFELSAAVNLVIDQLNANGCPIVDVKENHTFSQAWYLPRCKPEYLEAFKCFASLTGKDVDVNAAVKAHKARAKADEALRARQEQPKPEAAPEASRNGDGPIDTFNKAATMGLVRKMLEDAGYKFAFKRGDSLRFMAPQSETRTAGVTVFKGRQRGDIVAYSHHGAHDPLSGRLTDAFGILWHVTYAGDQEAALQHAKGAIGWASKRDPLAGFDAVEISPEDFNKARPDAEKPDGQKKPILANPFRLVAEGDIPPRQWVYGRHLIRRFVSATVAPGGVGKSSLSFVEAMAMATGKPLLGVKIEVPLKVWVWCLEDPREELDRRFTAIAKHYGVAGNDIGDRLFLNSGRDTPLCVARQEARTGTIIIEPDMPQMEAEIARLGIDVVVIDPFVASHMVSENDNVAINTVMRQWVLLAERCNIAIELIHHTRKNGDGEVTAETSRGAKALTDATRDTRVINQMSEAEGARFGVENRRLHFRTYSDKANLAPPAEQADWYKLENIALLNGPGGQPGDYVGVASRWEIPGPFAKVSRETIHALLTAIDIGVINGDGQQTGTPYSPTKQGRSNARWVGQVIMDIATMEEPEAKRAIDAWVASGVLVVADFEHGRKTVKGVSVNKAAWSEMVEGANVR